MAEIGVTASYADADRQSYLQELSAEQLIGGIAAVSSCARGLTPDQNSLHNDNRVVVFKNGANIQEATGIIYVPPCRSIGELVLADSLDIAKQLPHPHLAGALMHLMIPMAHLQLDGNGAASRFYQKLFAEGYNGSPEADKEYGALLAQHGRPENGYKQTKWQAAFAEYYANKISTDTKMPFTPPGVTIVSWQGDNLSKFPFVECGGGVYMVERNFATAFDVDFIAHTGRKLRNFTSKIRNGTDKGRYINTEKLLLDARSHESSLADSIGDSHKKAYLAAINDHVRGQHPAFRGLSIAE